MKNGILNYSRIRGKRKSWRGKSFGWANSDWSGWGI